MALAYLLKQHLPPSISEKLVAFVVDHKLRPESTNEAEKVKGVLEEQLGTWSLKSFPIAAVLTRG
jgi:tRNA(Ile)-lysidine synthase TilS/MesJ